MAESVSWSYTLDKKNDNTFWSDAITKEMKDVSPALQKLYRVEIVKIGYQRVKCHMIFDVNM